MPRDFTATITNKEHAEEWARVLGTKTVFIQSPIPHPANLPGHPNALVYMLDLETLTNDQRTLLIAHLSKKFGIHVDEVRDRLETDGVPILADDCTVAIHNPQRWF